MAVRQPPGFMAGSFTAAHMRAYGSLPFLQDPASASIKAMSGVIPRGGNLDFALSQAGSVITIGIGAAIVAGTENLQQHAYQAIAETAQSVTIPAASTSQTRLDRIVLRIRDSAFSGASADGDIVLVQGVQASSNPQLPAEPANSFTLATSSVTGTGTPVVTPAWRYTTAAGGIRPARAGTVDDGLAPLYAGQYRDLNGQLLRGSGPGGTWQPVADSRGWQQFTPTLFNLGSGTPTAQNMGGGGTAIGRYLVNGKVMHLRYIFRAGSGFLGGFGDVFTELPPGFTSAAVEETQILAKLNATTTTGTLYAIFLGKCFLAPNSRRMALYFPVNINRSDLTTYRMSGDSGGTAGTGFPNVPGNYPLPGILVIQGTVEIQ